MLKNGYVFKRQFTHSLTTCKNSFPNSLEPPLRLLARADYNCAQLNDLYTKHEQETSQVSILPTRNASHKVPKDPSFNILSIFIRKFLPNSWDLPPMRVQELVQI